MDIPAVVKEHPLAFSAVGVAVLFLVFRGNGGNDGASQASMIGAQLQAQKNAQDNNATIAGINAQVRIAEASEQAKLAGIRTENAARLYSSMIGADVARVNMALSNSGKVVNSVFQREIAKQKIASDLQLGRDTVDAGVRVALADITAQYARQQSDNMTKLAALSASLNVAENQQIRNIGFGKWFAELNSGNLPGLLQNAENMLRIKTDASTRQAEIASAATIATAEAKAKIAERDQTIDILSRMFSNAGSGSMAVTGGASSGNDGNLFGDIVKGISSVFSFL